MDIEIILQEIKAGLLELYGRKLVDLFLYGSWARDEATKDSDIDLLVILEGDIVPGREIDRMIDVVTELSLKYDTLISVYPISREDFTNLNSPLLLNIRQEGILA
jgi:predicted nucleotidyltransferase